MVQSAPPPTPESQDVPRRWSPEPRSAAPHGLNDPRWLAIARRIHGEVRRLTGQDLPVRLWDGSSLGGEGPFRVVLEHPWALRALLLSPSDLAAGEAYVYGDIDVEGDAVAAMAAAAQVRGAAVRWGDRARLATQLLRLPRPPRRVHTRRARLRGLGHTKARDRAAIAFHYDLPQAFYETFLDPALVYSCAYFDDVGEDVATAQLRKLDLICRKLRLRPGMRLLDIGCGWGSLLAHAARHYGVTGVGVTLSAAQADAARGRLAAAGLDSRVLVRVADYRDLDERFDAVASVGMVEHVGPRRLPEYFAAARRLLNDGGLFLNHGIVLGDADGLRRGSERTFVSAYVFPDGGLVPAWWMTREFERGGFELLDTEQLRPHYALTLRSWVRNLEANHGAAVAAASETDYRIWRAFMAGSAHSFESGSLGVVQLLGSAGARVPLGRRWMLPAASPGPSAPSRRDQTVVRASIEQPTTADDLAVGAGNGQPPANGTGLAGGVAAAPGARWASHATERRARRYLDRFTAGCTETTAPAAAAADIAALARISAPDGPDVVMALRAADPDGGLLRFHLYRRGSGVALSAFVPILESLGLTVVEEVPARLDVGDGGPALHIHDFGVASDGLEVDVDRDGPRLAEAAQAVWEGRAQPDSLNRLVAAGLAWDEVAILRTYRRYRIQVGAAFSQAYLDATLVDHPEVARALIELFAARFDPSRHASDDDIVAARDRVVRACDAVDRLDADRILRGYLALVDATLRTNRWVTGTDGAPPPFLALKLDSHAVPGVPKPVPYREIFVASAEMEGIHLRGGPLARGGIRWSDRLEDYRTEVLGLMKAQMVKNALIVPTGAKGGFVLKQATSDPERLRAQVRGAYETFVRGLLDVTDNVTASGDVVAPAGVRRWDGDDPYLVVAADRGTATFSDLANAISAEYGFWLGDAFASGGSRGYDHKALGITARGAWVAVRRHFRELRVDPDRESITAVGVGDLSGDVFGNGMLRSAHLKLVAAFDHRDILLDPDPDPTAAFAERRRLFALPRSSWQDYDRAAISEGGGVWSREIKAIPLSAAARRVLDIDAAELAPPALIQAILRAPVDLLYAGGIGTFVKARDETQADVEDRVNDAIRVNADEVRARVVAEGGNLAVTQRGRIEYARAGGRINTDAVDNSAGVDTSDHEVNLKVVLALAEADGDLAPDERDRILDEVADDVADAVLRDVYLQTGVLSHELAASAGQLAAYDTLMTELEGHPAGPRLDRTVEFLPSSAELSSRADRGEGLTRPELAVLLGYTKANLANRILAADLPDAEVWRAVLCGYFPPVVADRFCDRLHDPRLRVDLVKGIVATTVANDLVNRLGITFASRTAQELGLDAVAVAAAYWAARTVAGADTLWRRVEALDAQVAEETQRRLAGMVNDLVGALTRSYLRAAPTDIDRLIARQRSVFAELAAAVEARPRRPVRGRRSSAGAVDGDLVDTVASLATLTIVPDVAAIAAATGHPAAHVAAVFRGLDDALPFDRIATLLATTSPAGSWERWQHQGLLDDLGELRRSVAHGALLTHPSRDPADTVARSCAAAVPPATGSPASSNGSSWTPRAGCPP